MFAFFLDQSLSIPLAVGIGVGVGVGVLLVIIIIVVIVQRRKRCSMYTPQANTTDWLTIDYRCSQIKKNNEETLRCRKESTFLTNHTLSLHQGVSNTPHSKMSNSGKRLVRDIFSLPSTSIFFVQSGTQQF